MNSKFFFMILSLLSHAATANAAADAAGADFPALAAHYRETRSSRDAGKESADWYFARRDGEVETARADHAEVWKRDTRGEVGLTRVFHPERKLIHYTSGELRAQTRYPDWAALNAIFDPRKITALKRVGAASHLGRPASRYRGTLNGQRVEVIWLDSEALVARIARSWRGGSVALELKELRAVPDARWPQAAIGRTESYALLDGADLGDMEYDPFVQRVLGREEGHGGHAHHHH